MEIVSINGKVLYDSEKELVKDAVSDAVESGANLSGADLRCADLGGANLSDAHLSDADLSGADLSCAKLSGADLSCANLRGANLSDADLGGAKLRYANLRYANLLYANLRYADLSGANLYGANLKCANLRSANLYGANLKCANLYCANLKCAKNIPHIPLACPSEGVFTAWKKVNGHLIELEIPDDARRSSSTTEKCRCDKAKVISITDIATNEQISEVINYKFVRTLYKVGEMVYPDAFDEDRYKECSNGIHFFIDKQFAINY